MCFNFIQVSVKKLNLNSLKFSVTLYLTNIQTEVFIVSNEICTQLQWSYHCYDDNSNSISISWKKTCQKFFKLLGQSLLIINNIGVSGSFLRGGQQLHPAKIQSLPAEIYSCQWGHVFCQATVPSFSAKLSCSANGQIGR